MNGAEALVEMLIGYDTQVIFGLPGDTTVGFYDALHAAAGRIEHVMARDERCAAYMADVYSRLSGKPGVCEGPSGGGATYLLPGVVEANGSSVAMIALTTDNPLSYEAQGALTDLPQTRIFGGVTKWSAFPKSADMVPHFLRRAFRLATGGRPGAVHLAMPKDVLAQQLSANPDLHVEEACKLWPSYRTRPDADSVTRAAKRLLAAQRPVIIAGGGAVSSGAGTELMALAELVGAPVGTTINGKGAVAETWPLSLGVTGGNGGRPYANRLIQQADLVLYVGTKVSYVDSDNWRVPSQANPPKILQIDVDASELGNNYPIDEGLCGDARLTLLDLLAAVKDCGRMEPVQSQWRSHAIAARQAWHEHARREAAAAGRPIMAQRVIHELQLALPAEAVVVCDPGTPTPYMAAQYELDRPGRRVISPRAQGSLGYAIPGVVGARYACPDLPVVGLTGDGSYAMSVGDLITVARTGGPTVLILFNNSCFGWIKELQKLYHGERYFSVDFRECLNYLQVAEGFGLPGEQVNDPSELGPALRRALASDSPSMIEIMTAAEHESVPPPPVAPWERMASDAGLAS